MLTRLKTYTVRSEKVREDFRCILITDLHNRKYGDRLAGVLSGIRSQKPDLILCAGDLVVGMSEQYQEGAMAFISGLAAIAPVYFSNGNHETEMRFYSPDRYAEYIGIMKRAGVHILNNSSVTIQVNGNRICIYGLELGLMKYKKFRVPHISQKYLEKRLGRPEDDTAYHILMAHNPEFGDQYCGWGADLVVSGHFHGGLIRSPFTGRNLLSPYGFVYPRFGYGQYIWTSSGSDFRNTSDRHPAGEDVPLGTCMITSAGLGDHRLPIRIFDPHELVCINIRSAYDLKG